MLHGQNVEVKKLLLSVIGQNSIQVGPISIQVGLISIHFPNNLVGFPSMSIPTWCNSEWISGSNEKWFSFFNHVASYCDLVPTWRK